MKKVILFLAVYFLCSIIQAQVQLTISQAITYQVACHEHDNLDGYWLDVFGKKFIGQEYINAKNSNDEFKLNRFKKTLSDKYAEGKIGLINPIFYVTELIDNYSYDFSNSSVKISFGTYDEFNRLTSTNDYDKLDVYTEGGVRRNWMTKGFESDDNPEFSIRNADNIPTLFEMPVDIAEKSFAQRKGNNRPAFKLRYYFKFLQCGSGADVDVVKVELIDDIMNYKKAYEVEHYEPPAKPAKPVNGNDTVYYNSAGKPEDNKYSAATYRVITYVDGKISGTVKVYYMSGKFYTEAMYNDKTNDFNYDGLLTWYYENGTKFCEVTYADGVMNGKYMSWYSNGEKKEEVNFINNKKEGCDYMWDEKGNCLQAGFLSDWTYTEDYFTYYENGVHVADPKKSCRIFKRTSQNATLQENQSNNNNSTTNNSSSNSNQQSNATQKKISTIYNANDLKLVEGFIDLSRIEVADKEYFISQFNQKGFSLFAKSKIRFEQSKDFDDILIGYEQKGKKPETQSSYMYYKGILFYRIGNYLDVVRKLQNGIGFKMFVISPPSSLEEIYYEK